MEMGLLPGTRVEAVRRAPMGDPLKIRLRGYLSSLRLDDAAQIQLAPDDIPSTHSERNSVGEPCHLTHGDIRETIIKHI